MSEQDKPKSYMHLLDEWTERFIIEPLILEAEAYGREGVLPETRQTVMKAIREKVLESYRNGQAAGPAKANKRPSYAKR
jgi:hypothetical protein